MMNLTHWRLVVSVADTGKISQGAERVGMTQSGASQAIAQLEKVLGDTLFTRTRREAILTAFGESVVENARAMLASFDAIRGLADENKGIGTGRLRLGSFPSVISAYLLALVASFRQRYPGIEVVLLEGTDEEVETWLASGAIDLGVVLNPEPERQPLILGKDAWVALVPTSHPLARRSTAQGADLAELVSQPFIHATGGCRVNGLRLAQDRELTFGDIRVTVRDWGSACDFVRENLGIAIVPESILPADRKGLRALPLAPSAERQFGMVSTTSHATNQPVNIFWQHVESSRSKGKSI